MSDRKSFRNPLLAAIGGLTLACSAAAPAGAAVQFVDLQWLKPGITAQNAGGYFTGRLEPIVRKHGGRVIFVYRVLATMKGDVQPAVIASMEFPSMEEMQALFRDAEYQKIVPERDATFDLARQSLFQVAPVAAR